MTQRKYAKQSKYPWERWLSRKRPFVLKQGVDFTIQTHGMAQMIRDKCSRRDDLSVSIKFIGSNLEVTLKHEQG